MQHHPFCLSSLVLAINGGIRVLSAVVSFDSTLVCQRCPNRTGRCTVYRSPDPFSSQRASFQRILLLFELLPARPLGFETLNPITKLRPTTTPSPSTCTRSGSSQQKTLQTSHLESLTDVLIPEGHSPNSVHSICYKGRRVGLTGVGLSKSSQAAQ